MQARCSIELFCPISTVRDHWLVPFEAGILCSHGNDTYPKVAISWHDQNGRNAVKKLGQSTTAKCRCGYTCRAVFGGTRNATLGEMTFPHYCSECGVVNATPFRKQSECPRCRSAPLHRYGVEAKRRPVYILGFRFGLLERTRREWDKLVTNPIGDIRFEWAAFSVTEGDHRCPACQEMTLRFDDMSDSFFD